MDQGGCPITYVYTQLFTRENIIGLVVIGGIYALCMVFAVLHSRKRALEMAMPATFSPTSWGMSFPEPLPRPARM